MPAGAAGEPGLTTFCEHGGLVHRPVLASLLGGAFASGKSFEYSLGPPEDMVQRVQLLVLQHLQLRPSVPQPTHTAHSHSPTTQPTHPRPSPTQSSHPHSSLT